MRRTLVSLHLVACGLVPLALALVAPAAARAQTIAELQVTPEKLALSVGQRQAVSAAAFDRRGNLVATARIAYLSLDPTTAQVARDGTVTGVKPGTTRVEARAGTRRASLAVTVTAAVDSAAIRAAAKARATALTVDPVAVRLLPGERVRLTPQALRDDGSAAETGRVQWKSLRPEVATVDSAGYVAAVTPGRSIVQVTGGSLMATVPVDVEAAEIALTPARLSIGRDEVDTMRAFVPSQGNRAISGLAWRSSDSTVVQVDGAGLVVGRGPGTAEVVVTGYGQERRVPVVVHKLVTSFVLSPPPGAGPVQIPLRGTRTVTARPLAADSTLVAEAAVGWTVADSGVAGFDPATGLVTGRAVGTTTLTGQLPGFAPAVWTLRVVPGDVALDQTRVGLVPGGRARLTLRLMDESGQPVTSVAPDAIWSVDRGEVAAVDSTGAVEARSIGRARVSAVTPWGKQASADLFVSGELLVSSSRRGGVGIFQIVHAPADSLLPLYGDSGKSIQPVRSPDGTRIAFASNRSGSFDIYVMDADGQGARRLTADPAADTEPVWAPDGRRIFFSSGRGGSTQVYSMNAEGGDVRALTSGPGGNSAPAVSPDGRRIVFASARDGNYELYETAPDGISVRRLTTTPDRESLPRFLPGGDLLYVSDRGAGARIMRLPAAGGAPALVADVPSAITGLGVSRDGSRVAYVTARLAGNRTEYGLFVRPLAPGAVPVAVRLAPGEQVVSPSF